MAGKGLRFENHFSVFAINKFSNGNDDDLSKLCIDARPFFKQVSFGLIFFSFKKTCFTRPLCFKTLGQLFVPFYGSDGFDIKKNNIAKIRSHGCDLVSEVAKNNSETRMITDSSIPS